MRSLGRRAMFDSYECQIEVFDLGNSVAGRAQARYRASTHRDWLRLIHFDAQDTRKDVVSK